MLRVLKVTYSRTGNRVFGLNNQLLQKWYFEKASHWMTGPHQCFCPLNFSLNIKDVSNAILPHEQFKEALHVSALQQNN